MVIDAGADTTSWRTIAWCTSVGEMSICRGSESETSAGTGSEAAGLIVSGKAGTERVGRPVSVNGEPTGGKEGMDSDE